MQTNNPTKEVNQGPAKRKEFKQQKKQQKSAANQSADKKKETPDQKKEKRTGKLPKARRRIFPIWLRLVVVFVLCGLALICGLMFGYGVLGDGKPTEALEVSTWEHIVNIVTGKKE
ncbi:DNA-directed RNA polymerase subunit beta [Sediminibacillus dalangtanensis]|uniref:DNA-directed RNA polymerase subunit beta n=1 Tax=Sediminibacillus dalangtanensis TaxID=2729421 RepID=A0ABX7VV27_9BACI|nr:DNA-directed RNA polymerase subunit beta [Sediminibacillus dalangtanensis]QTN00833.1 DNA-directed RNA polymerase subunit beta [Sediminibacillus dalangtanensis]